MAVAGDRHQEGMANDRPAEKDRREGRPEPGLGPRRGRVPAEGLRRQFARPAVPLRPISKMAEVCTSWPQRVLAA